MPASPLPEVRAKESRRTRPISERLARIAADSQRRPGRPLAGLIRMDNGDPGLPVPPGVARAIRLALARGDTHYAPPYGSEELRQAIGRHLSANRSELVPAEQILITHGATAALFAAVAGTLNARDAVLIPEPSYSIFPDVVRFADGNPILVPTRADFHLDLEGIEACAPRARMIILCNPCSPTGVVYTRDELQALADTAVRHDLLILADEVYASIVFDDQRSTSFLDVLGVRDRLFYAQSFSKTYAMAGLRTGYLACPTWAFDACARAHHLMAGPTNSLMQKAATAALEQGPRWLTRAVKTFARRRDLLLNLIADNGVMEASKPSASLFVWAQHNQQMSSAQLVEEAARAGVAIRAGTEFGPSGEGYVAITFAVDEQTLTEGFSRLRQVLRAR